MVVEGATGTVDWCLEPERQTSESPCPLRGGYLVLVRRWESRWS